MEKADTAKAEIATTDKETQALKAQVEQQLGRHRGENWCHWPANSRSSKPSAPASRATWKEDLLDTFNRLFHNKSEAVVALEHDVCTGCHMKITTQTVVRVKGEKEIVHCEQCGRMLYLAEWT